MDADLDTRCVAQAIMGIPSDRKSLAVAGKRLVHLFAHLPGQPACWKRRRRLVGAIEWLRGVVAAQSPGFSDDLLLCDSTPVPRAQSRETVKRSALVDAAGYGYCAAHSRLYRGFRLHLLAALDGTPRAIALADPARGEREFAYRAGELGVAVVRPRRADEAREGPHLSQIHQRMESTSWTCKDLLTLARHGARALAGLREGIPQRFLCLAACIRVGVVALGAHVRAAVARLCRRTTCCI